LKLRELLLAGFRVLEVFIAKDKPGHTNLEKNFSNALKDIPTLTELSTLALYNIAVSQPFMKHIRSNGNILLLESFFQKKADFLESIIKNPSLWTNGNTSGYKTASLDGKEWNRWSVKVLDAIKNLSLTLPDLNNVSGTGCSRSTDRVWPQGIALCPYRPPVP